MATTPIDMPKLGVSIPGVELRSNGNGTRYLNLDDAGKLASLEPLLRQLSTEEVSKLEIKIGGKDGNMQKRKSPVESAKFDELEKVEGLLAKAKSDNSSVIKMTKVSANSYDGSFEQFKIHVTIYNNNKGGK